MQRMITVLACVGVLFASTHARGSSLGFDGPFGSPIDPTVEGGFRYFTLSGNLFREVLDGSPGADVEGSALPGHSGGVLSVVLDAGGLFTFEQVDITQFGYGVTSIDFEGFLGGSSEGVDSFATSVGDKQWTTVVSVNLMGIPIDELRITLDAVSSFSTEDIDNLVVNPIPEPSAFVLTLLGLLALTRFPPRASASASRSVATWRRRVAGVRPEPAGSRSPDRL
ncbi:MAG TPA: hypothetical protein VII72_11410 [Myxococcota bacterium]|jgi:hypothetical protein